MLKLPQITLICLTNKNIPAHEEAIKKSCEGIEWGAVKLIYAAGKQDVWKTSNTEPWIPKWKGQPTHETYITDIEIKNIDDWNRAIIYELHNYVDTEFAMLIHADGFVVNPAAWKDEFLAYDYIGAPWPLPGRDFPDDGYSYRTPEGEIIRMGNSVSLRSRKILEMPQRLGLEWRKYYGNTNEDGFLCVHNKSILERHGINFAPIDVAKYFSKEHEIEENKGIETFAFHQVDL